MRPKNFRVFPRGSVVHPFRFGKHAGCFGTTRESTRETVVPSGDEVGIVGEGVLLDDISTDDVFLKDAFDDIRGAGVVPNAIGVDDGDGAVDAGAEAVGFGAEEVWSGPGGEAEFGDAAFEVVPGIDAELFGAALGFGLIGAKKEVAACGGEAEGLCGGGEILHGVDLEIFFTQR